MGMPANAGLEYWQNVLVAGGSTVIPRWTLEPVPGVGDHGDHPAERPTGAAGAGR